MTPVYQQVITFGVTIVLGAVVGVIFDFYGALQKVIKPRKITKALGDFLIWIIITALVFYVLLSTNWGEVRVYVFIGLGLGFLIYKKTCSSAVFLSFQWLFTTLFKILAYPIRVIKNIVQVLSRKMVKILKKIFRKAHKNE